MQTANSRPERFAPIEQARSRCQVIILRAMDLRFGLRAPRSRRALTLKVASVFRDGDIHPRTRNVVRRVVA
jgi:hypothetical protein